MASPGHEYLPDLRRCFTGDALVFSWAETFRVLSNKTGKLNPHLLNVFISSPKIKSILSQKVPSFPPQSQQSRSQFETKTAPISVTPSSGASYDIEEIKKNATWLSTEVELSEEEALRIVILEWQQEPAEKLVLGYSDAELASLQDSLGERDEDATLSLGQIFPKRDDKGFELADSRRQRLLDIYFREQMGLLGVSRKLQELTLIDNNGSVDSDNLRQFAQEVDQSNSTESGLTSICDAVESRMQSLESGKSWSVNSENATDRWIASELQCILCLQEIMLLKIRGLSETVTTDILLRWLQIMAGCEFFFNIQPGPLLLPSQVESLQAMSSLTTLAMLDPATTLSTLSNSTSIDPASYFLNGDAAHDVHRILLSAAEGCLPPASPAALAWALILGEIKRLATGAKESRESGAVQRAIDQVATYDTATGRRTSSGSLQQSIYEDVISAIMNTSDLSDPATYLLRCTVEAVNVFDTISILAKEREFRSPLLGAMSLQILQELVSVAVSSIGYTPEILGSQFSILSSNMNSEIDLPNARETFVKNDFLMDNIFAIAAGRFPYESLAFLRLCKLLAAAEIFDDHGTQYITFRLRTMDSYTQNAVGLFAAYHTIREDENLNLVALDSAANIFQSPHQRRITYGKTNTNSIIIPTDTLGEVISESIPPVIRWQHAYSGLALLGAWLELHYLGQLQSILPPYESADEVVTEVIGIITALLQNTVADIVGADAKRLQDELLDETSSMLQTDSDVADYVFEILEQELQAYRRRPSNTFNSSVLVACIKFATIFSQIRPDQFWPLFSKSSLLESYGSDSFLLAIVAGVEVPSQNFIFLHSCAKLLHALVSAVLQQSKTGTPRTRSAKGRKVQPQTLRLHANVLMSLTQSLYNAFETIPSWSFASRRQQTQVVATLAVSFEKIIIYSNEADHSKSSLTSSYLPASDFLAQQLRLSSDDLSSTTALLQHIFRTEELRNYTEASINLDISHDDFSALLSLSQTLIRLGRLRSEPPCALDQQLFNAVPLFCRNVARSADRSTIHLVQSLLVTVAKTGPVSLLGHLGSTSATSLLELLKLNLGDWSETSLKISIWELLANLVGRNQQWLAIVILTGSPPDKIRKDDKEQTSKGSRGRTFMEIALKQLSKIIELDPALSIAILKFVIKAQMNWSWANEAMKSDKDVLPAIMSYVCNTYVDVSDDLKTSYRNRIASLVTDLTTIHLHHAKAKRDMTTLKTVIPLLWWLTGNAIDVASYNHSLHSNLRKNFGSKFSGLELSDFKRTGLFEALYGDKYYYDLDFANEILGSELQWERNDRFRDQTFSAEFRRANLNLSVVDSEVKLLNSLLNLCIEHSGYFAQDPEVQKVVVDIVKNSLDANTQVYPSENIFDNILQVRADMVISLLQRLVDVKPKGLEVRTLLNHAWECARANNGSFEQAITDNNLTYWRSMLTIVLMTLQFQVDKRYMPPAADSSPAALLRHTEQATSTILEIIMVVVGQGFRSVSAALQDQNKSDVTTAETVPTSVSHKDVYIILTIFETILRMTRLPEFVVEASQKLIAERVIQSCLLLYSWSHVLTVPEFDNEPIYAGYCLRFLASLSSLPPVTEELAVEGVLSRLLSSRITQKLQNVSDGAAHLDKRPHVQILYNLWANGLLPICLNLLHSVGAPVAAEVSIFLNQFVNQLNRASVAFITLQSRSTDSNAITSTVADEAMTLALISYILSSFRNAGASAAVDPSTIQLLTGYDEHKKALSEDISDVVNSTTVSLKNRIIAINEKELTMTRKGNGEGLVKKVVSELRNALTCLKGEEVEDEK